MYPMKLKTSEFYASPYKAYPDYGIKNKEILSISKNNSFLRVIEPYLGN
jgi:hypothetical protein